MAVYNKERRIVHTYLGSSVYRTFILMKPFEEHETYDTRYCSYNTAYDLLPGNRFIIYIFNSSTVYIFKGKELEKKIIIWPKEEYKRTSKALERIRKFNKNKNWIVRLFSGFFIDGDNHKFFYLHPSGKNEKNQELLYKFSLDGELVCMFYFDFNAVDFFKAKKNNLFFGMTYDGDVKIMQEEIR